MRNEEEKKGEIKMNDCVWCFMFCDCERKCDKYLSANSPEGEKLIMDYQKDIDVALEPVKQKWQETFQNGR
jgi:hypothetical protein